MLPNDPRTTTSILIAKDRNTNKENAILKIKVVKKNVPFALPIMKQMIESTAVSMAEVI